jgi:hypothetical protein
VFQGLLLFSLLVCDILIAYKFKFYKPFRPLAQGNNAQAAIKNVVKGST